MQDTLLCPQGGHNREVPLYVSHDCTTSSLCFAITSTVQALESASILYLFLCSQLLALLPPCAGVQLLKEFQAEYAKFEAQRQELTNAEKLFDLPLTMYPNLIEVDQQLRNLATIFQLYEEQRVGALIDAYNDTSMQSSHT